MIIQVLFNNTTKLKNTFNNNERSKLSWTTLFSSSLKNICN